MKNPLEQKNDFVIALRRYLESVYQTKQNYTFGEGEFEGRKVDGAYCLVSRDPSEPKDLTGFCFRKDLVSFAPRCTSDLLLQVHEFALRSGLESKLGREGNLKIRFAADVEYLILASIDEGYAGEISLYFAELPCFELVD